ncbi:WxL protein peptidoglycan domain-containing protein [Luteimicrobium sp. DT211]|uniref:WxL protein peptidoglycan domain-containing protein n=1 Tax=Luteimicrobium sp. DT211 TaxID=3393412 RepID=UPI003CFB8385
MTFPTVLPAPASRPVAVPARRRSLPRAARAVVVLLVALVAGTLAAAPTTAAPRLAAASPADQDVTWTVRTASNDRGADRTSFAYTLNPGRTTTDGLVVANHGKTALELAVYAADGYTTDAGQFDLLVAGQKSVGVGAWVAAGKKSLTVAPGKTVTVPFTVAVPENATPGDYAGGIVTSLRQEDEAEGINVDRRLGVRLTLHVGGKIAPAFAVEDVRVQHETTADPLGRGDATVTYTLHNTGNTIVSAQQAVSLAGPFGRFAADVPAPEGSPDLLPGESWPVSVTVPDVVGSGRLTAHVTATPVVTDASGSTSSLAPVEGSAHGWAVPWVLLAVVVVVAAAVVLAVRGLRRARSRRRENEDARVEEAVAQALRAQRPQASEAAEDAALAEPGVPGSSPTSAALTRQSRAAESRS